jgi:hypothetical protein
MRRRSQRARNLAVGLTQSTPGRIARIRDCRIRILVAGGKCIYRRVPGRDGGLGWPSTGIDPRYVRRRQSLKSCDHRRLKIGPGHFRTQGPPRRCNPQSTVHRRPALTQVHNLSQRKRNHFEAGVSSASATTQGLVQKGSAFPGRDPDCCYQGRWTEDKVNSHSILSNLCFSQSTSPV